MRFTEPRYTRDLDIWIDRAPDNARRVIQALVGFGAPVADMLPTLETPGMVQIGVEPVRVDILTSVPGLEFNSAWNRAETDAWEDATVRFLSKADLIKSKQAAGRPQDLLDLEELQRSRG
jgi:hypothetical protein